MVDSTHDGDAAEFTMLIAAIAEAWPRLEAMFARGDEWREFAASLLYLLREAEEEGSQVHSIDTAIRALLAQHPSVHALVRAGIDRLERRSQADASLQFPPRTSDPLSLKRYQRVLVLFGTDRARRLGEPAERVAFGNERGALTFGQAEVSIRTFTSWGAWSDRRMSSGIEFRGASRPALCHLGSSRDEAGRVRAIGARHPKANRIAAGPSPRLDAYFLC